MNANTIVFAAAALVILTAKEAHVSQIIPPSVEGRPSQSPVLLQWEFKTRRARTATDDEIKTRYFPSDVSLKDATGKRLWRQTLPRRLREQEVDEVDVINHRDHGHQKLRFIIGLIERTDAVVIADASGVLALRRQDGQILMDYTASKDAEEFLHFDQGWVFVQRQGQTCTAKRCHFMVECADRLVYFNGQTAAVFGLAPYRLERDLGYRHDQHRRKDKKGVEAEMSLGDVGLVFKGEDMLP